MFVFNQWKLQLTRFKSLKPFHWYLETTASWCLTISSCHWKLVTKEYKWRNYWGIHSNKERVSRQKNMWKRDLKTIHNEMWNIIITTLILKGLIHTLIGISDLVWKGSNGIKEVPKVIFTSNIIWSENVTFNQKGNGLEKY